MDVFALIFSIFTEAEFENLKNGNPEIIKKLYLQYKDRIFVILLKKFNGDVDTASEILSETFVQVMISVSKLKNQKNLGSWLLSIAFNEYRGYVKKYKKREKIKKFIKEQRVGVSRDPIIEDIDKKYKYYLLKTALEQMKLLHQKLYKMKYIEEKKYKEIATILDMNTNAVGALLYRIKEKLKVNIHKIDKSYF